MPCRNVSTPVVTFEASYFALDDWRSLLVKSAKATSIQLASVDMFLVLQQVGGPARVSVRQGQRVTFGRTRWSDHAFPRDESMEPIHFLVDYTNSGARVAPHESAELFVDGELTKGASLRNGQRLQSGCTIFEVVMEIDEISGNPADATIESLTEDKPGESMPEDSQGWVSATRTLQSLLLPPIPKDTHPPPSTAVELAKVLETCDRHADAIQVLAWSMEHVAAVKWVADCIQKLQLSPPTEMEETAMAAALTWCSDPTSENCTGAGAAAEVAGMESPAGWLAQAIFWGGDNLSASDLPPVKPPPSLASAGIKGTVVSLAFLVSPDAPDTVLRECLAAGYELATH